MKSKKITQLAVATALFLSACSAPKLSEYAEKTDLKSKAKYDFNQMKTKDNGKGFAVNMKALGKMPKRVALISFYVDDPGLTKIVKSSYSTDYKTTNTGSDNAKMYANFFLKSSLDHLKSTFAEYGMEVLTPDQFLTDNDKKSAYDNFVVKHTTLNKIGQSIGKFFKNSGNAGTTIETDEAADGYNLIKINNKETSDPKKIAVQPNNLAGCYDGQMIESIGYELTQALGVDAVIIIYNSQLANERWSKSRFWLSAVNMQMFGPNPTPLKEGKRDGNGYSKGVFYGGVRMRFSKGLLINPKTKTDAEFEANTNLNKVAYNNMLKGCSKKLCDYLKDELE